MFYWFPVLTLSIYASFFQISALKTAGIILIVLFTFVGMFISYNISHLSFNEWYHEIMMCGVDKLSMSITVLSYNDEERRFWMIPFEAYFGIFIKFLNPAFFCFFLVENLATDMKVAYGITTGYMPIFASLYLWIAILIIIVPMIVCDYPELFTHNVEMEFAADDAFELKERMRILMKNTLSHTF